MIKITAVSALGFLTAVFAMKIQPFITFLRILTPCMVFTFHYEAGVFQQLIKMSFSYNPVHFIGCYGANYVNVDGGKHICRKLSSGVSFSEAASGPWIGVPALAAHEMRWGRLELWKHCILFHANIHQLSDAV